VIHRFKYRAETTNGAVTDTAYSDVVRTAPSFLEAHLMLIIGTAVAVVVFLLILVVTVILLRCEWIFFCIKFHTFFSKSSLRCLYLLMRVACSLIVVN